MNKGSSSCIIMKKYFNKSQAQAGTDAVGRESVSDLRRERRKQLPL